MYLLLKRIFQTPATLAELVDPKQFMFCAAKYSEDEKWYRGQVLEIIENPRGTVSMKRYITLVNF